MEAVKLNNIMLELASLNVSEEMSALWKSIHTDQVRKYHDWRHIHDVLVNIDLLILHEPHVAVEEIKFAALFHDFFHALSSFNDVVQSAEMAVIVAKSAGFHSAACKRIRDLVLSTSTHESYTVDQRILCDSDLSILSSDWRRYSEYSRNIRQEYHLVPDDMFYRNRKHILEELLKHPSLYQTEYGKANWEQQARDNLSREISEIEKILEDK